MIINSNPGKFLAALATRNATAAYREIQEKTMTNAIEQAKREMYEGLKDCKSITKNGIPPKHGILRFENSLEAYLELLRQDHEALHETARGRWENLEKLWVENGELTQRLAKMTEERDSIQLRLHAVDHAYKTQQDQVGTSGQTSVDRASCAATEANADVIRAAVRSIQLVITDWGMGDLKAKKAMRQIARIVNGDGAVADACGSLEKDEPCKPSEKDWREIAAEHEERHEAIKAKTEAERRKHRLQEVKMNCAIAGVALGVNHALWSALAAPAKKETCQHSFFAIGDDQMKCTFCGVGK